MFHWFNFWRTCWDALKGKVPWLKWWKNLKAVLSLPAVYLGIARDFWIGFDKYLEVEKGLRSTFFFLPYKGQSGDGILGTAPRKRASTAAVASAWEPSRAARDFCQATS